MPLRRRAWLTREGWYYCGVLAFIVGGAVMRSINLLVVLAGLMIAPLVINWRLVMATLWGLSASRKLPEQICAGETLAVEVVVENSRRWMASWLVRVEDWVEREEEVGAGVRESGGGSRKFELSTQSLVRSVQHLLGQAPRTRTETLIANLGPQQKITAAYQITLHQRGRYRFGPLRVSTRFPLGLVWGHFTLPAAAELLVAPRLGRLSPAWARLMEAEQAGDQRRQPERGYSDGDYYGLRPWQSGDSTRWIHWRATAKTGVPTVLQFERLRNRDVALVLDPWLGFRPHEADLGHLELAISLAATALADLSSRGHARLVLAVAGDQPDCWTGPASPRFCQELLAQLAVLPASDGRSLTGTLAQAQEQAPGGARLVVISSRPAPADLPAGGELVWIDTSSDDLPELFSLE